MSLKIFGQVAPAANTLTTLYTVPVDKVLVISVLFINNRGNNSKFNVALRVDGAPIENKHWIYFEQTISAGVALERLKGATLQAGTIVSVQGQSANFGFTLCGEEIDA
jgi:hypothetical protein